MKNDKFFGYAAAVGAFLVMFVNLGTATTLGVFLTSLSEYSGWSITTCAYIGTACTISCIIFSIVSAKLLPKLGPKKMMIISVVVNVIAMLLYTFATPGQNTISLVCFYLAGFLVGVCITFGSNAVCGAVIAQWFIDKREKVCGIVFSGSGFGSALWVFVAGQLFKSFDYKQCYYILSIAALVIGLFAILFFVRDPEKMGQKPLGWDNVKAGDGSGSAAELPGLTKAHAVKTSSYWFFAVTLLCVCCAASAFTSYAPAWWQAGGMSSTGAANWQAIFLIIGGLVLLVAGSVFGKIGSKAFSVIICVAFALCMVCLVLWGKAPSTTLMVLTVLFGAISYPLATSVPGLVGQSVFGPKDYAAIIGGLMTFVYIGQFLYAPIMSIFSGGESGMGGGFIAFAVIAIIGMIFLLLANICSPYKPAKKTK